MMKLLVRPGYRKSLQRVAVRPQSAPDMVEVNPNVLPLDGHAFVERPGIHELLAVSRAERPNSKPLTDFRLTRRMQITSFSNIDRDGEARLRHVFHREQLRLAQFRPPGIGELRTVPLIWQLHDKKGKVPFLPGVAPSANHRRQE